MGDDQDFAEKRDFIRMFINAPVDFAIKDSNDWHSGVGIDLSGGGLSFSTKQSLSVGDQVEVKLKPITPVTPALEANVVVIRSDTTDDGTFNVSTKIENIIN